MECSALGIPCFATKCLPYSRVMPESQLFENSDQLKSMLQKLKFMSTGAYRSIIENQWKWFHTPCREGDFVIKNYWLEDNLDIWINLSKLRPKCPKFGLSGIIQQYLEHKKVKEESIIYKNENIEITK